ncbi:MAG: potassium-transporting ATPase subunit KdpC [Proteobacteria bacterium]|nr:potassium-transporting ATPase subunit KdpC [Pseudomonadota bacterium]
MTEQFRAAAVLLAVFTVLTGIVYPLAITGVAQVVMPQAANGSLLTRSEVIVGSKLIGQTFASEHYFHGRPSAAGDKGYDAANSSGSNLGPLSKKLIDRVTGNIEALRPLTSGAVPADAVTASASGLDPEISPAYALLQAKRVAAARNVSVAKITALVDAHIKYPFSGFLGEPRINVLLLNLALDDALGAHPR